MAKSIKPIVIFMMSVCCKMGYSEEPPTAYTEVENHIQRVVVLSKDKAINGIKETTHRGSIYFSDTEMDSIAPVRTETIYFAEKVKLYRKVRLVGAVEIRQTNCVFLDQTDTVTNFFAEEVDATSDVFWAQVKTSYLLNILEQNNLISTSDSLWILIIPQYFSSPSSQYYIYQYCENARRLQFSVISSLRGSTPQVIFSGHAQLHEKEQKILNENLACLDIHHQTHCIDGSFYASFIYRTGDKYRGVFRTNDCDRSRVFNIVYPFIFTGKALFRRGPEISGKAEGV